MHIYIAVCTECDPSSGELYKSQIVGASTIESIAKDMFHSPHHICYRGDHEVHRVKLVPSVGVHNE